MGRIGERDGAEYEVNLPDCASLWLNQAHIFVRCSLPSDDPVETLTVYGHETATFHDARFALLRALIRQRAVTRGLTGLSSSRIELFAHQVEVARRVLQDPIQRYLLADEVGLGKTVEAGIIIRQFLLDDPTSQVLVLAPAFLVSQWRRELASKFGLTASDGAEVLNAEALSGLDPHSTYGLLVVDEAHHLAAAATGTLEQQASFAVCERLARTAKRVLLLSATPAATDARQFLAMLHLLDPETYPIDGVAAFRARVAKRQEIGAVLLTLTETARPYSLRLSLARLTSLFPDDELLAGYAKGLAAILESDPTNEDGRVEAIRTIRAHVSETYRLHRRMLRNRRGSITDAIPARSSHAVQVSYDVTDSASDLVDALEEWRTLASVHSDALSDVHQTAALRQVFLALVQLADGSPRLLRAAIDCRMGQISPSAAPHGFAELSQESVTALQNASLFPGERDALTALARAAETQTADDWRAAATVELLRKLRDRAGASRLPKCVVFTSFSSTAHLIARRLREAFGSKATAAHTVDLAEEAAEATVQRFVTDYDCFVLVCDRSGEEGRNFQLAEHLIHYDLPWDANRLEQRIGRVDRISRRRDLTVHVLLGAERVDALGSAWYALVHDGLHLFANSIASLQFYIDAHRDQYLETAFRYGAQGLLQAVSEVRADITSEQLRIEEQAAIDEIDARDKGAEDFFRTLDDSDAEHHELQSAVECWLCNVLGFSREPHPAIQHAIRYRAERNTLLPEDVLRTRFAPHLSGFGTYDRTVATQNLAITLFRLGDSLIDAIADYAEWDDRGQAFAIWRQDRTWSSEEGAEWVGYRFDLLIEADISGAAEALAQHGVRGGRELPQALRRQADALVPPRMQSVFVDVGLNEISDSALADILKRPFSKVSGPAGCDYNLTKSRVELIDTLVSSDAWEELCRSARDASITAIRLRPGFRAFYDKHARGAKNLLFTRVEQLDARIRRDGTSDHKEARWEAQVERDLSSALVQGVRNPMVSVVSCGFIVVSGRAPGLRPLAQPESAVRA